jgi:hypothetical protein
MISGREKQRKKTNRQKDPSIKILMISDREKQRKRQTDRKKDLTIKILMISGREKQRNGETEKETIRKTDRQRQRNR